MSLLDERCPFYWWARSARHGVQHAGWPIMWVRSPGQQVLSRYAAGPPPAIYVSESRHWPTELDRIEALNAGEGEV
jgi:hypothetical protein